MNNTMIKPAIAIVGAGNVGQQACQWLATMNLGPILLLDIVPGVPQGKALDMMHALAGLKSQVVITGSNDFSAMAGAKVVVITAGVPRKPGMSRKDLLSINSKIVTDVCGHIKQHAPDSMVIVVSNPLDAMVHVALSATGFAPQRIIGMAGMLDSMRFTYEIAHAAKVSPSQVEAMVMGSHSDHMVPLVSQAKVNAKPLTDVLTPAQVDMVVHRTKHAGAEIVGYLQTGSAFVAPGLAIAQMVSAVIHHEKKLLSATAYCQGEYNISNMFMGVPCILGKNGVEAIVVLALSSDEQHHLKTCQAESLALLAELNASQAP